jgi:hypothetical protein
MRGKFIYGIRLEKLRFGVLHKKLALSNADFRIRPPVQRALWLGENAEFIFCLL